MPPGLIIAIRAARRITVLSGAGMSAESGLPTFRDPETGVWAQHDPALLATPEAWRDDPGSVWCWYQRRRVQFATAEPNDGHRALALLSAFKNVSVVTQNCDDLHERAGSRDVLHIHGRIADSHCDKCGDRYLLPAVEPGDTVSRLDPSRCSCGGLVRPSVVWFGEQMPLREFGAAIRVTQECDVLLIVGTSGLVYPAASLPQLARSNGALIVEIGPHETGLSEGADIVWRSSAASALEALLAVVSDGGGRQDRDRDDELDDQWSLKREWDRERK